MSTHPPTHTHTHTPTRTHAQKHVGAQPRALANAVYAYAANIDNLGALADAVKLIAHKHTALHVLPEHYPMVRVWLCVFTCVVVCVHVCVCSRVCVSPT
jgi:hemoglobin-like flavoprotein